MSDTVNELTYVSFDIIKSERTEDGDLLVWGRATDGSVDSDDQIVDTEWSGKAVQQWLDTGGNVRVQHSPYLMPAGKGMSVEIHDDGAWVKSLVVEDQAKKLVEKGVLQAYSIGIARPTIVRDATGKAKGGRITGGEIAEISLVDRPANKNCGITLVKSEGDDAPWSMGDLDAALKAVDDAEVEETKAAATPTLTKVAMGAREKFAQARQEWLDSEPKVTGQENGTQWLGKRAEYAKWHEQGVSLAVDDDTDLGFQLWSQKDAAVAPVEEVKEAEVEVEKGGMKDCPECGKAYHADSKVRNCENCGAKLPTADKSEDVDEEKAAKPDAKDPDDDSDDDSEDDSDDSKDGEDSGKDGKKPFGGNKAPPFGKKTYSVKRMHDALCAAYSTDAVLGEYASLKSIVDAVVYEWFEDDLKDTAKGLIDADRDAILDARAALHKAFTDDYPDTKLSPSNPPEAGSFKRPALSAGHASTSPSAPHMPQSTHVPDAGNFTRGPLTAGEASDSPSNKGGFTPAPYKADADETVKCPNCGKMNDTDASYCDQCGTKLAGNPDVGKGRSFYTNAAKDTSRDAMQVLHDHISGTFPDLCPMHEAPHTPDNNSVDVHQNSGVDVKATSVPTPVSAGATSKAPGEKEDVAELVKSMVADQLRDLQVKHQDELASLRKQIDELGSQPDPAQAPVRGVVAKAVQSPSTEDGETVSKARKAHDNEQADYVAYMQRMSRSGDPVARELALKVLSQHLNGTSETTI